MPDATDINVPDLREIARSQGKSARVESGMTEGEVAIATSREGRPLSAEISWPGDGGASRKSGIPHPSESRPQSSVPRRYNAGAPDVKSNRHQGWRNALSTILIIIAAPVTAMLLTAFVFQTYEVDGPSMEKTLHHQDRLIVFKAPKTWARITNDTYIPDRGDIIVFVKRDGTGGDSVANKQLIKRVIGLPGDQVIIRDGKVTIKNKDNPNGFNPDASSEWSTNAGYTSGNIDITVSADEVFVLGDNRNNSLDSRSFGTVPADDIVGKLTFRMLPLSDARSF